MQDDVAWATVRPASSVSVAWASAGAMQTLADMLVENIEAWEAGRPVNLVAGS